MNGDLALEELTALGDLIAAMEEPHVSGYVGVQLMSESLQRRRARVIEELAGAAAAQPQSFDIALKGPTESGADLGLVAGVLSHLQDAVRSLAQGAAGRRTIQELVAFRVALALPGSLALRLVPAIPASVQLELLRGEGETLLEDTVVELIESIARIADEQIGLEAVGEIRPHTTAQLQALTGLLATHHTDLAVSWRSPRRNARAALPADRARAFHDYLETIGEEQTQELVVDGRLVGGSLVRKRFELELPDGTVLSGTVTEPALADLELLFGQGCRVVLTEKRTVSRTGATKESYVLVGFVV